MGPNKLSFFFQATNFISYLQWEAERQPGIMEIFLDLEALSCLNLPLVTRETYLSFLILNLITSKLRRIVVIAFKSHYDEKTRSYN